jgi:glycosyltransferase involved in cell wall biosynthesis
VSLPPVSLGIPCWKRADALRRTLETIRRQNYPKLEIVVAEDDDDGGRIREVCGRFGAKHVQRKRVDQYPPFQCVSAIWNLAFQNCSHEIVILQTDDILHESPDVIQRAVEHLLANPKCIATPLVRNLNPAGEFVEWFNHPATHGEGNHLSGTGPFCMWRQDFERIGGFEELFYGYGYEDNYFHGTVRRNSLDFEYVMDAVCAHPSHERWKYEPITGFANRALIRILELEIEDGMRIPKANAQPLDYDLSAWTQDVDAFVESVRSWNRGQSNVFEKWVVGCWLYDKNPDTCAEGHRGVACDRSYPFWRMDEMVIETAWGLIRANIAVDEANRAPDSRWGDVAWRAAKITHTWASRALAKACDLRRQFACVSL